MGESSRSLLVGVSVWAMGVASPAWSQNAPDTAQKSAAETTPSSAQQPQADKAAADDQAIIIAANKRSERLQDVPLAVTALTGSDLEAANARSFVDFARSVPSLSFADYGDGRQRPAIRGISVNT